jgi:hypothetical protein
MWLGHVVMGVSSWAYCDNPLLHILVDVFGSEDHDGPDDRIGDQSDNEFHDFSPLRGVLRRVRSGGASKAPS